MIVPPMPNVIAGDGGAGTGIGWGSGAGCRSHGFFVQGTISLVFTRPLTGSMLGQEAAV